MKKTIGYILLLLVVAVAAAPFGFSFWADSRLNLLLSDFNQGGVVDFTVIKKNKGWFSSNVIIEAELAPAMAQKLKKVKAGNPNLNTPKVILKSTIYHGPFPFMSGQFSLKPVIGIIDTKFIKDLDSEEPLVNIEYDMKTELNLAGSSDIFLDIPEWSGPLGDKDATVEWKGLVGVIKLAKGLKHANMDIKAPLLKISSGDGSLVVESLELKSSSKLGIAGLSLGTADFSIASIEFNDQKKGSALSISNTVIKADTTESGGNINSKIDFNMAKLKIAGDEYGPAVFSMAFRNLEASSLARINEKIKEIQGQAIPKDQASMMMGMVLMSELTNLLKQGPEIEIAQLSLASTFGRMSGHALVSIDASRPELLSSPMLIKDAIMGELDFEVPEELLVAFSMGTLRKELKDVSIQYTDEQLRTMARSRVSKRMAALLAANIFIKVGNMYKISASFEKGVPTVNGKILAIPLGGAPSM